jgi:hypothetical protein
MLGTGPLRRIILSLATKLGSNRNPAIGTVFPQDFFEVFPKRWKLST